MDLIATQYTSTVDKFEYVFHSSKHGWSVIRWIANESRIPSFGHGLTHGAVWTPLHRMHSFSSEPWAYFDTIDDAVQQVSQLIQSNE